MFKIIDGDFQKGEYSNEEYLDNWPMLYILENGKQAYIGESTHAKSQIGRSRKPEYYGAIPGQAGHGSRIIHLIYEAIIVLDGSKTLQGVSSSTVHAIYEKQ